MVYGNITQVYFRFHKQMAEARKYNTESQKADVIPAKAGIQKYGIHVTKCPGVIPAEAGIQKYGIQVTKSPGVIPAEAGIQK